MKIWLDDIKTAPAGWLHLFWPEEVYPYLEMNAVDEISLDHDLGNDKKGTGYDILIYIERNVKRVNFKIPKIHIHTQNPVARSRMQAALNKINNSLLR